MKWAAGLLAVMLYAAWPYYTLVELAGAVRSGDAATINQLVDWQQVRANLKTHAQTHIDALPRTAQQRELEKTNPEKAAVGNAFAVGVASALIDRMVTPESMTRVLQGRGNVPAGIDVARWRSGYWERIKFAFFVSPIHFQLELLASEPARKAGPTVTVMLTFKGTGWQVSDLRLSKDIFASRLAQASPGR